MISCELGTHSTILALASVSYLRALPSVAFQDQCSAESRLRYQRAVLRVRCIMPKRGAWERWRERYRDTNRTCPIRPLDDVQPPASANNACGEVKVLPGACHLEKHQEHDVARVCVHGRHPVLHRSLAAV